MLFTFKINFNFPDTADARPILRKLAGAPSHHRRPSAARPAADTAQAIMIAARASNQNSGAKKESGARALAEEGLQKGRTSSAEALAPLSFLNF